MEIKFEPIELDSTLPICGGEPFEQLDGPIRVLHFHGCLEIGLCYEGSGVFVVADKVLPFRAGDVSFISGDEAHRARSTPGTKSDWAWIYFDPLCLTHWGTQWPGSELDPSPLSGPSFCNIVSGTLHPQISHIVARLVEELRSRPAHSAQMQQLLIWQLLIEMKRVALPLSNQKRASLPYDNRLDPALRRLANTQEPTPSISEMAALCGLSEAHFRRLFRAFTGQSPREYVLDLRLRLATARLRGTTEPVLSISRDAGFDSLSSFNRAFRKTFGMSPSEWRQMPTDS